MKRVKVGDAEAVYNHAYCYSQERICGYSRNQLKAIKLWHLAGDSGCTMAYSSIAIAFCNGEGVAKNEEIAKRYWEHSYIFIAKDWFCRG